MRRLASTLGSHPETDETWTYLSISQDIQQSRQQIPDHRQQLLLPQIIFDKLCNYPHGAVHRVTVARLEQVHEGGEEIGVVFRPVVLGYCR